METNSGPGLRHSGAAATVADLPPADTKRWVVRRKMQVVSAVRDGLISLEEACSRYALSVEEFSAWKSRFERLGPTGLRATRTRR